MSDASKVSFQVHDGGRDDRPPESNPHVNLTFGGGGGGGGSGMDTETLRFVEAKVDSMKAQNDARFSEVLSRLDGVNYRLDHAPNPITFWQYISGLAAAIAAILSIGLAVLAISGDRFDGGMSAGVIVERIMTGQSERDDSQDARLDEILEAISRIEAASRSDP